MDVFASKRVESRVATDNLSGPQLMESPYSPILPRRIGDLTKDMRLGNVHDNRKNLHRVRLGPSLPGTKHRFAPSSGVMMSTVILKQHLTNH